MTLNQIKYMVKVAEYGSINKVASMSFVSQSVISTAIKNWSRSLAADFSSAPQRALC